MTRNLRAVSVLGALVFPLVAMTCASRAAETDKGTKKTWGDEVEGQALSITTEKAAYAPAERIVLNVCFKNVGRRDVEVVIMDPRRIYHIDVLLPDGKPAPLTLFGKGSIRLPGSRDIGNLKPGEETCTYLELSRLFDFTLAGKYTVSVERSVSKNGVFSSKLKSKSNKLEITVDRSSQHDAASAGPNDGDAAKERKREYR